MFKVTYILTKENFGNDEVKDYLFQQFHPDYAQSAVTYFGGKQLTEDESQERWAHDFRHKLPRRRIDRLNYITNSTNQYWQQNHVGTVCQKHVWPEFFKVFPRGKILLGEIASEWYTSIWHGQFDHSRLVDYKKKHPSGLVPQEMSGLLSDSFPLNSLLIAAYGIYPLVLFDYVLTSGNLVFIYVPQESFRHSQMTESGAYVNVLWRLHHVLNDQWTFNGSRGPKSEASSERIGPTENLKFIQWTVESIGERMDDLIALSTPLQREQLAMTFSRAVCDAVLSVSTQLPYISKVFFFSCIDKLANIQFLISDFNSEIEAFKRLVHTSFLQNELVNFVSGIPDTMGKELTGIVQWVSQELAADNVTPEVLRDIRNTHHGYGLRQDTVERLFKHSGELNNDITLLATPLVLFVLSRRWSKVKL